jgi:hypothetical protein
LALLLVFLAYPALLALTTPSPAESLDRARATLQSMTRRLPRYTCVETINRVYYQPPRDAGASCPQIEAAYSTRGSTLTLDSTDRLRLEVTMSEGREIHAWPGATRFDVRNVDQIIHQGPVGTGSFGTHLIGIFDNPSVAFHFAGELSSHGRHYLEYRYTVPLEASRYHVKTGRTWAPVAYQGSFRLDSQTLQLESLSLESTALPPASNMCSLAGSFEYQQLSEGTGILFPRRASLKILGTDGRETSSVTSFSGCREYQAESEVRFDTAPDSEAASARPVVHAAVALPLGLPVVLSLISPIDTDTAAAGDPVSATVIRPVRRASSGPVLIPSGATVLGRITRLEHHLFPEPYFLIALSFNRLVEGATSAPFAAKHDTDPTLVRRLSANLRSYGRGLEFWDVGTFLIPTPKPHYILSAGFQSKWETLAQ